MATYLVERLSTTTRSEVTVATRRALTEDERSRLSGLVWTLTTDRNGVRRQTLSGDADALDAYAAGNPLSWRLFNDPDVERVELEGGIWVWRRLSTGAEIFGVASNPDDDPDEPTLRLEHHEAETHRSISLGSVSTIVSDASTATVSHTTAAGTNRLMMAGKSGALSGQDTNVTYNSVGLTDTHTLEHTEDDYPSVHVYRLLAPDEGTFDFTWDHSNGVSANRRRVVGIVVAYDVHQTTPLGSFVNGEVTDVGSRDLVVTTDTGDVVYSVFCGKETNDGTNVDGGAPSLWTDVTGAGASHPRGAGHHTARTGATTTVTWEITGGNNPEFVATAVALKIAEAGGDITGSGALVAQAAVVDGAGVGESAGSGTLEAQAALVDATGASESSGTGTLAAQAAVVDGAGTVTAESITGSGALAAGSALVSGAGLSASEGAGALVSDAAMVQGAGAGESAGSGALVAQAGQVAGTGEGASVGTGALQAAAATVEGEGDVPVEAITGAGTLVAAAAVLTGAGVTASTGAGTLAAQGATVVALGEVAWFASGALQAQSGVVAGEGTVLSVGLGALVAGAALVEGEGEAVGAPVPPAVLRIVPGTHRTPRLVAGAHRTPRLVPGEHRP